MLIDRVNWQETVPPSKKRERGNRSRITPVPPLLRCELFSTTKRHIYSASGMSNTLSRQNVLSQKLFGIYFGGYSEDISGDFVSSFEEHSRLCDEKDGTKGRK